MNSKNILILLFVFTGLLNYVFSQPIIEWQKSLGGTVWDQANTVCQTKDGGYIVGGNTISGDGDVTGWHINYFPSPPFQPPYVAQMDAWIIKLDSAGIIQWNKCLGGTSHDMCNSIRQTFDNGYILGCLTSSNDDDVTGWHPGYSGNSPFPPRSDQWIVKLDSIGSIEWQKCLGGQLNESTGSIRQTRDSGYIVVGYSPSNDGDVTGVHGYNDVWLVKLNNLGVLQWQKCLGGVFEDYGYSVEQTFDNGFVIAGETYSNDGDVIGNHDITGNNPDEWIVKVDSAGTIEWQKCLGGTNSEIAKSIQQTSDSGYIVGGYTYSYDGDVTGNHGSPDYWLVKLNSAGVIQWQKCLGGSSSENAYSIQLTNDNGFVIAGYAFSNDSDVSGNHGGEDFWIVKLDSVGTIDWQKCLGGSSIDDAYSIQQTSDSGYIVAGITASIDGDVSGNHGDRDGLVVKLSPAMSTGLTEKNVKNKITIFPNPLISSSEINFNIDLIDAEIIIYDLPGREIKNVKFSGRQMEIERGIFENGVYLVKIKYNDVQWTSKLIISRN